MIMVLHVVVNKIDIIGIRHKVYDLPFLVQDVWNRTFGIIVSLFLSRFYHIKKAVGLLGYSR